MIKIVGKGYKYFFKQLDDFLGVIKQTVISLKRADGQKQYKEYFGRKPGEKRYQRFQRGLGNHRILPAHGKIFLIIAQQHTIRTEKMDKKSPFFTASAASVTYFIIFVLLKYLLQSREIDWLGALQGAVIFWIVIFVVHQFLKRRFSDQYRFFTVFNITILSSKISTPRMQLLELLRQCHICRSPSNKS